MSFCSNCGFNLEKDEVLTRDGFTIDPRGAASFLGHFLPLTKAEALFLHTMAAAGDRPVKRTTIGARVGSSEDPAQVASVLMHRVRKTLTAEGAPCPIVMHRGRGYRWECLV